MTDTPESGADKAARAQAPLLSVLRGEPTPAELAALVAVVAAASGARPAADTGPLDLWGDRDAALRTVGYHSFSPRAYVNGDLGTY